MGEKMRLLFLTVWLCSTQAPADDAEGKAVKHIERLGGLISRWDEGARGKCVTGVDLNDTKASDADVEVLLTFSELWGLTLRKNKLTDAGLKQLANLRKLGGLQLDYTKVTGAGLSELASLQEFSLLS